MLWDLRVLMRKGEAYFDEETGRPEGWNLMLQRFMTRLLHDTKIKGKSRPSGHDSLVAAFFIVLTNPGFRSRRRTRWESAAPEKAFLSWTHQITDDDGRGNGKDPGLVQEAPVPGSAMGLHIVQDDQP
jgi:hypothetical protein